jgi:signal transduction histidine kinase
VRSRLKIKAQKEHEEQQRKHQEELTRSVIDLQERERERFAKDLHDDLGQMITTLKFHMEGSDMQQPIVHDLLGQMHSEIRNISFALSPHVLNSDGLQQAVEELADRLNKSGKINIEVISVALDQRLNKLAEITLYRICQEWLTNVLKYSKAKKITLQFLNHTDELVLTIEDDGVGFNTEVLEKSRGNGWKNIVSRARLLNATVEADSKDGQQGTLFSVAIPNQDIFLTQADYTRT